MRYNVYLKTDAENGLRLIFEYLKAKGDIPANATEVGDYRSQCITYAIFSSVGRLSGESEFSRYGIGVSNGENS